MFLIAVVALAACRPSADRAAAERSTGAQRADVTDGTGAGTPSRRRGDPIVKGAKPVVPDNAVVPGPGLSPPTNIPRPFRGRWGLVPADCTSTRGDAKGLLVIDDARLTFYEAKGTLGRILLVPSPTQFDASFGFSGEGQTWDRIERLELVEGNLHRRTDPDPAGEPAVDLTYQRCPA
jgi:hypothetical protein